MRINGKAGRGTNTCAPRKRKKPTKAEKILEKRVQDWEKAPILQREHKPGSLKK